MHSEVAWNFIMVPVIAVKHFEIADISSVALKF